MNVDPYMITFVYKTGNTDKTRVEKKAQKSKKSAKPLQLGWGKSAKPLRQDMWNPYVNLKE